MKYTYADILAVVTANGDLFGAAQGSLSGTFEIDLRPYQEAVLDLNFKEFKDQRLENDIISTAANPSVDLLLGINKQGIGDGISDTNHGSVILDSERVVINAKDDFAFLFGSTGVALGSPNRVNIDSGQSITLFAHDKLLLGIPNKGLPFKQTTQAAAGGTTKGDPTPDQEYEPLVLGIKLANLLEDILFFLKKADLVSGVSPVRFQPSTLAEFALLANRIPEMLSSYAFIDGYSHETINQETLKQLKEAQKKAENYSPPTKITGSVEGVISVGVSGVGGGTDGNFTGQGLTPVKELIASVESFGGDYNVYNYGASGGGGIRTSDPNGGPKGISKGFYSPKATPLTKATIAQVLGYQQGVGTIGGERLFAIGKYQCIPNTLKSQVQSLKLPLNSLFDEVAQEKIGDSLLLGSNLGAYLKGTNEGNAQQLANAVQALGQIFASLPVVKSKTGAAVGDVTTGQGNAAYYGGDGPNKATSKYTVAVSATHIIRSRVQYSGKAPSFIPTYYTG